MTDQSNPPRKMTRRDLLKAAAVAAGATAAGAVLQACQSAPAPALAPTTPPAPAPTAAPAAAPKAVQAANVVRSIEPNPKRGGTIKIAGFPDPAHFDLDQSASIGNLWPQSPMYDNLIRFNPMDGGRSIIPDLAEKWEISPDGLTYTFKLRSGVQFHDGTPLTADDVIATFQRRKDPPQGVVSIRSELFKAVSKMEAPDPLTVRFVLSEPRGYFLEAIATGWSAIFSKKSIEANKGDFRRVPNYPGTGPYVFKEFTAGQKWAVERNPNYWNKELPYVDRMERIFTNNEKERGTAVLSGQVDMADHCSPDTHAEALKRPDQFGALLYPVTWANTVTWNCAKPPFNDPRVRRAVHLAISRQDLAKAYETAGVVSVGTRWAHPGSPMAGSMEDTLKLPGYRAQKDADIAEAKQLMAAAGYANGVKDLVYLQRGLSGPAIEIFAPAFQDLMKRHLGIEMVIKPVETSVFFDVVRAGDFNLTMYFPAGAINDPSDYFAQWFKTKGPQNYGAYSNPKFDDLLARIDKEMDNAKRKVLVREAEDLLDQDNPMYFHGWFNTSRIWRKTTKGLNHDIVGSYIVARYDTLWLDK